MKKTTRLIIAVLIIFVVLLAAVLLVAFLCCGKAERLEKTAVKKVDTMLTALEEKNYEKLQAGLHPVTGKDAEGAEEGLQALLTFMEGKKISSVETGEVTARERADREWLVSGTGSITLDDGSVCRLVYTYLSDGSEGFITFIVQEHGVSY